MNTENISIFPFPKIIRELTDHKTILIIYVFYVKGLYAYMNS